MSLRLFIFFLVELSFSSSNCVIINLKSFFFNFSKLVSWGNSHFQANIYLQKLLTGFFDSIAHLRLYVNHHITKIRKWHFYAKKVMGIIGRLDDVYQGISCRTMNRVKSSLQVFSTGNSLAHSQHVSFVPCRARLPEKSSPGAWSQDSSWH